MKARTSIILDTRRQKKGCSYPVKLRITYNRERKYYPLNIDLFEEDFEKTQASVPRKEFKTLSLKFQSIENKAVDTIDLLGDAFTFSNFEAHFVQNRSLRGTVEGAFDDYINSIEPERIGTIETYRRAQRAFAVYKQKALIGDVSVQYLKAFEAQMRKKGRSATTTGIYCRCLRSVLNTLIADGKMSRALYPFGSAKNRKYEIPTSKNKKRALILEEISIIANAECTGVRKMCRDYWLFIYMGNGLNVADFCRLKQKNLKGNKISFLREKQSGQRNRWRRFK